MPLLQERDFISSSHTKNKIGNNSNENGQIATIKQINPLIQPFTTSSTNSALLSSQQLLAASQTAALMAAASAGIPLNFHPSNNMAVNLFHQSFFGSIWPPTPPSVASTRTSPSPNTQDQHISPSSTPPSTSPSLPQQKLPQKNNNNNIVSSSSNDLSITKSRKRKPKTEKMLANDNDLVNKLKFIKNEISIVNSDVQSSPLMHFPFNYQNVSNFENSSNKEIAPLSPSDSHSSNRSNSISPKIIENNQHLSSPFENKSKDLINFKNTNDNNNVASVFNSPSTDTSPTNSSSLSPHSVNDEKEKLFLNGSRKFTCTTCNRSFGYKHVLQNHMRTHTGEKPFECPECHKRFTRDHHLRTHIRLHTGERPYHCTHCGKYFVQVANLRRHLRVHTGERPYTCNDCDASFSDSNQLKSHNLIHKGEKPFNCDKCGLKFRRKHHLGNHKCGLNDYHENSINSSNNNDNDCDSNSETDDFYKKSYQNSPIRSIANKTPLLPLDLSKIPEQTEPEDLSVRSSNNNNIKKENFDEDLIKNKVAKIFGNNLNEIQNKTIKKWS